MHSVQAGLVAALLALGSGEARSEDALFSFGEMRTLQRLPVETTRRVVSEDEFALYQNMQFYTVTAVEALLAANNAVMATGAPPLFCAPEGTFRFEDEGDIAGLLARLTQTLVGLVARIGAGEDHYDERPASEALLLALRVAHPCDSGIETASAQR